MDTGNLTFGFAFLAGLASFLSPCVFSLVPAYVGYLSGYSAGASGKPAASRWTTLSHGLAFVLGFSTVFILIGLGTSAIGTLLYDLRGTLTKIGGLVVVVLGLHMTGIIRIPFLMYDTRRQAAPQARWGYLSSALLGVFFSAGWSPCVGPILGAILTIALSTGNVQQGAFLLTAYSLGLAIPFLVAATQIGLVTRVLKRYGSLMHWVEVGMGVLLVVVGVLLFFGKFTTLTRLGFFFTQIDELAVGRILLIAFVALTLLGLLPAWIASRKGRNFYDWWFFGAALFPVALPVALMLKETRGEGDAVTR